MSTNTPAVEPLACPSCGKVAPLCLCAEVHKVPTRTHVLILQHPQEPDKTLGSARLAHSILSNSTLKVGLSWPNLSKAVGRPVENARWGVLYLGPKPQGGKPQNPKTLPRLQIKPKSSKEIFEYVPGESPLLEGIIVLDGTWSQAKTLWWRNAWLLKVHRLILNPQSRSMYGELRREPRRDALSTIESIAEALEGLSDNAEASTELRTRFGELLRRFRATSSPAENTSPRHEG